MYDFVKDTCEVWILTDANYNILLKFVIRRQCGNGKSVDQLKNGIFKEFS